LKNSACWSYIPNPYNFGQTWPEVQRRVAPC